MMILEDSLRGDVALLVAMNDRQARLNAFLGAIRRANGFLHLPIDDTSWGPGVVEVSHRGIFASGATAEQAMAEWLACARRVIAAEVAVTTVTGSPDELTAACATVRTRSQDAPALAAQRRLQAALAMGLN